VLVDQICPLLTLGGDRRIVSGAPDAAHRCSAGGSLTTIERDYQARYCLTGRHETCERYLAHVDEYGPPAPTWRAAAPDATFASTRIVVDSAPRSAGARRPPRLGLVALVVIGLLLVGGVLGWMGLRGLAGILAPEDSPAPSESIDPVDSPLADPSASGAESPITTAAPTPSSAPTPTPAPTPVTYIVQSGDTLNEIAARFGTTAQAIMDANGLTSDIIQVGQVLIIPIT
jgi:LysM repeat protein